MTQPHGALTGPTHQCGEHPPYPEETAHNGTAMPGKAVTQL